jgi:hypothetical protein
MCDAPSVAIDLSSVTNLCGSTDGVRDFAWYHFFGDGSRQFVFDGAQCERQVCDGPEFWNIDLL